MSFVSVFNQLPIEGLLSLSKAANVAQVSGAAGGSLTGLRRFAALISPAAGEQIESLGREARRLTRQRFGKTIRFFAPLYLSNECINNCKYCGFSRDNPILRVTLSIDEVVREARSLLGQGFRNILLVAGEHPKFVSNNYLRDCVAALRAETPGISLEVGPMETAEYEPIRAAGAEGLVVYQETYDRAVYEEMHTAGPKRNFDWRLETPERAYEAGFRRLGIGALYGLSDWRREAIYLAAHAEFLLRQCWKAQVTVSFPRLRLNAGEFEPLTHLSDRELAQLICAFRICFPDIGLVLSTREPAKLRDGLIALGITHVSAGSHTEPGGYTGAGRDNLHLTQRGRIVALENGVAAESRATGQFDIADERAPSEVAAMVQRLGLEPVWKDWDAALSS
ncbi:MAG: 2-iminoacetate synthase ThiH [Limisphaerales bacterium]